MKFIEVRRRADTGIYYVDVDKAYKFSINFTKDSLYVIRAYFLTSQNSNPDRIIYPVFTELRTFDKQKEAIVWLRKLLGSFLEKET